MCILTFILCKPFASNKEGKRELAINASPLFVFWAKCCNEENIGSGKAAPYIKFKIL
jgi:hypothetical protein